jgi:hypothetical protein
MLKGVGDGQVPCYMEVEADAKRSIALNAFRKQESGSDGMFPKDRPVVN